MGEKRKSAKDVIQDLANEIMMRHSDPHAHIRLAVIETIALRMGLKWNDLYKRIRFRKKDDLIHHSKAQADIYGLDLCPKCNNVECRC